MVSQTTRYALQILGYLASHKGERVRGEEVAAATGIPANYLSKILNQLRKSGIVNSQKGWGGGFLVRPEALSRPIGDVVAIFEGPETANTLQVCVFGLPQCNNEAPCPLHGYWGKIRETYNEMIHQTTIGELLPRKRV